MASAGGVARAIPREGAEAGDAAQIGRFAGALVAEDARGFAPIAAGQLAEGRGAERFAAGAIEDEGAQADHREGGAIGGK